jgi:hypothetical protein
VAAPSRPQTWLRRDNGAWLLFGVGGFAVALTVIFLVVPAKTSVGAAVISAIAAVTGFVRGSLALRAARREREY